MTKTIASATDTTRKYLIQIDETSKAQDCTCLDRQYRHHECKHMRNFNSEVQKAEAFLSLKERFDVRGPWEQARRREAYCQLHDIYTY